MARETDPREDFRDLVVAYEADDESAVERLTERLRSSAQPLRLVLEEDASWEESVVDGYSEFPVVTQTFKVFLGDELLYEGERQFGSALEDPTHTGLGGRWVTIRVDDEEHVLAERALEHLGLEIEWPTAPPAR